MSTTSALAWQKKVYRCIAPREKPDLFVIPANIEVREHPTPCFFCGVRDGCKHRRAV